MKIDSQVLNILKKAGWYETRKLERHALINSINGEGYPIFENVVTFLQSFGNLIIRFANLQNNIKEDDINLNLTHAFSIEVPERVFNNYVPRIKKELVLIGTVYRDHMVLLMANDNNVYAGYDNYLCKVANSGIEAMEAIILNRNFLGDIP